MADRTSAALFSELFNALAKNPDARNVEHAHELWVRTGRYDFSPYQMDCDDALKALGLLVDAGTEEEPDYKYGPVDGFVLQQTNPQVAYVVLFSDYVSPEFHSVTAFSSEGDARKAGELVESTCGELDGVAFVLPADLEKMRTATRYPKDVRAKAIAAYEAAVEKDRA